MHLFTKWEHLDILLFAYHIGMVSYKTCFQNKIYVADKRAKLEEPMTLEIC